MNFAQATATFIEYWRHIWHLTDVTLPVFNVTIREFLFSLILINISVIIFRSFFIDYFSASPFKSNDSARYIPKDSRESKQSRTGGSL